MWSCSDSPADCIHKDMSSLAAHVLMRKNKCVKEKIRKNPERKTYMLTLFPLFFYWVLELGHRMDCNNMLKSRSKHPQGFIAKRGVNPVGS